MNKTASKGSVAIVDYGLANIQSVVNALECFSVDICIAPRGEDLRGADRIVLPGVGHFDEGMKGLRARGHDAAMAEQLAKGVPLLGVCLGLQFMFERSAEGSDPGLGWVKGSIERLPEKPGIKIPHMGWSEVQLPRPSRLLSQINPPIEFYFVHSYGAPVTGEAGDIAAAVCDHGMPFVAALERGNLYGAQFHPEKSQLAGMKLLETFLSL